MLLLQLVSCDFSALGLFEDPPDPEFVSVELECAEDVVELTALVDSAVEATNLVVELFEEDGDALDPVFPLNDLNQLDGRISRWSTTFEHDCDDALTLDWTVWTVQETSATHSSRYPEGAPGLEVLDPPYGSTLGGDSVVLNGEWLDEVVAIWVDGVSADILSVRSDELVFETPAHAAGDVEVLVEGEFGTSSESFRYYEDQTGLVRGIANMGLSYYSESLLGYDSAYGAVDGPFAQFEVLMHEPTAPENTWWGWHPEIGSCEWGAGTDFTTVFPGSYLGLEDLDGDLGSFAMITAEGGSTYYMVSEVDETWAGKTFELSWTEELDDLPAMSVEIDTAPLPVDASLAWDVAEDWPHGEDIQIDFAAGDLEGAFVSWFLTTSGNGILSSSSCMHDASTGELSLEWADMAAGVDEASAARVYLKVAYWTEEEHVLPHDRSIFWSRGVTSVWYRLELVDP